MMNEMNMKLPANCAVMTEDEMMNANGGFDLDVQTVVKVGVVGAAVVALGAIGVNMLNWFTGKSDSNFIDGSINAGGSFIQGAVNAGRDFLDGLLGK